MSVQNIGAGTALTGSTGSARFFLPGASDFAETLNLGQIIQGKVLRVFDGNRYLVAFGKDERVVDSGIPLTTGEILYGRVVGIGDRVELQRVYGGAQEKDPSQGTARGTTTDARVDRLSTTSPASLDRLLQRFQVELSESDRATLMRAARSAADPEAMALAGAMLSKLGLPQAGVLLDAVYRAQFNRPASAVPTTSPSDSGSVPQVVAASQQSAEVQASSIRELASLLGRTLEAKTASAAQSDAGQQPVARDTAAVIQHAVKRRQSDLESDSDSLRRMQESLADRILNAQTGGVVSHGAGLIPILVGGRLVEISFALFEQRRGASQAAGLQHRQVIFSLQTESMGQVDVIARITGEHVRVQITTGSEEQTTQTAQHADVLRSALAENGWNVDEVAYGTRSPSPHNPVVRSVIDHVVSLDSLNRLV